MENRQMQRPSADEYAPGYQKYFDLVPEGDYLNLLRQNSINTITRLEKIPGEKLDYRYAEGKWTIKEVFIHIIDTERVFSYRALVAARGDCITPHYRMDEELYAKNVDVSHRTLQSLISEFKAVRASTEQLFENLTDAQSELRCNIVTHEMTARAIGYFMIGHVQHHLAVIEERYL
ncbi:MAG: DinB family protein [Blastocatellia bacterium]